MASSSRIRPATSSGGGSRSERPGWPLTLVAAGPRNGVMPRSRSSRPTSHTKSTTCAAWEPDRPTGHVRSRPKSGGWSFNPQQWSSWTSMSEPITSPARTHAPRVGERDRARGPAARRRERAMRRDSARNGQGEAGDGADQPEHRGRRRHERRRSGRSPAGRARECRRQYFGRNVGLLLPHRVVAGATDDDQPRAGHGRDLLADAAGCRPDRADPRRRASAP